MFALVDCNNFYASCERVFNPKWQDKPLVVLSNNDGCIIARSNEAKALGIPMGAPYFQYKKLMEMHDVIVCSSNFSLYGNISERVMQILKSFASEMQIYSIDEAFMRISTNNLRNWEFDKEAPQNFCLERVTIAERQDTSEDRNFEAKPTPSKTNSSDCLWMRTKHFEIYNMIRKTVLQCTGIPISIGVGSTKTLAKVANQIAKKNPHYQGVCLLQTEIGIEKALETLPVTEIWGIGRQSGMRLSKLRIVTAKDLRDAEDSVIKKHLSITGLRTAWELRGISCLPLEQIPPSKQSITCSRSFSQPVDTLELLNEAVATYTANAAEKMRTQQSLAASIVVFVQLHPYNQASSGHFHARTVFPEPTAYTPHLIKYAKAAVKTLFQKGSRYRKAGIILDSLIPDYTYQQDFLSPLGPYTEKQKRAMKTIDQLNKRYGRSAIHTAAEGISKPWKMKQTLRSPHFTTDWKDILTIKI